jgi:hypothetical protein
MLYGMKTPLFVRELSAEERQQLEAGLRSQSAFTLRRCQILLASADQLAVKHIAQRLGFAPQKVRNVLHAFHQRGLACLQERSHVPLTVHPVFTADKREELYTILHQNPRVYGKNRSTWTLGLLAEGACEQGLSEHLLSAPTLLDAVGRLQVNWKQAKPWISSPDPAYTRKKPSGPNNLPAC